MPISLHLYQLKEIYEVPFSKDRVVREHESKVMPDNPEFTELLRFVVTFECNNESNNSPLDINNVPNHIKDISKARIMHTQFTKALERACDKDAIEIDRIAYENLAIKAVHVCVCV